MVVNASPTTAAPSAINSVKRLNRRTVLPKMSPATIPMLLKHETAIAASVAPPRCVALPVPADGNVSSPGFARAAAIRSAIYLTADAVGTATISGLDPTSVTGVKLLIES